MTEILLTGTDMPDFGHARCQRRLKAATPRIMAAKTAEAAAADHDRRGLAGRFHRADDNVRLVLGLFELDQARPHARPLLGRRSGNGGRVIFGRCQLG